MKHISSLGIFLLFCLWIVGCRVRAWCGGLMASDEQSKVYAQIDEEIEMEEKRRVRQRIQEEG